MHDFQLTGSQPLKVSSSDSKLLSTSSNQIVVTGKQCLRARDANPQDYLVVSFGFHEEVKIKSKVVKISLLVQVKDSKLLYVCILHLNSNLTVLYIRIVFYLGYLLVNVTSLWVFLLILQKTAQAGKLS